MTNLGKILVLLLKENGAPISLNSVVNNLAPALLHVAYPFLRAKGNATCVQACAPLKLYIKTKLRTTSRFHMGPSA